MLSFWELFEIFLFCLFLTLVMSYQLSETISDASITEEKLRSEDTLPPQSALSSSLTMISLPQKVLNSSLSDFSLIKMPQPVKPQFGINQMISMRYAALPPDQINFTKNLQELLKMKTDSCSMYMPRPFSNSVC